MLLRLIHLQQLVFISVTLDDVTHFRCLTLDVKVWLLVPLFVVAMVKPSVWDSTLAMLCADQIIDH